MIFVILAAFFGWKVLWGKWTAEGVSFFLKEFQAQMLWWVMVELWWMMSSLRMCCGFFWITTHLLKASLVVLLELGFPSSIFLGIPRKWISSISQPKKIVRRTHFPDGNVRMGIPNLTLNSSGYYSIEYYHWMTESVPVYQLNDGNILDLLQEGPLWSLYMELLRAPYKWVCLGLLYYTSGAPKFHPTKS